MKVTFRKEFNLDINMHRLMNECIDRSNDFFSYYEDLNLLVRASLEGLYNVNLYGYDNTRDIITVVAKNLLLWCLENNYIKEHDQLISGVGRRKS
jgi:hypothetical protein